MGRFAYSLSRKWMMSRWMSWEWYCSLFPSKSSDEIDPFLYTCECGFKWRFTSFQLLRMYLSKSFIHTCPRCQRKSTYRMISHVARDIDSDWVKEHNRRLDNGRV